VIACVSAAEESLTPYRITSQDSASVQIENELKRYTTGLVTGLAVVAVLGGHFSFE
jgi:hypothetical protein